MTLPWEKLSWARRELPEEKTDRSPTQAAEIFNRGDVIYTVGNSPQTLQFVQVPEAQSALVALDPKDGAVVALVGGFDYFQSKFNRVTQARRQPGSGFKPFVYAAAFDKGYTPASVVLDAPVVIDTAGKMSGWRPKEMAGRVLRPGAAARGAGPFAQSRLGAPDARHRYRIHAQLCDALRLRQVAAARRSDHGARHGRAQPAAGGHRRTRPSQTAAFG